MRSWVRLLPSVLVGATIGALVLGCDSGTTGPGFDADLAVPAKKHILSVTALPTEGGVVTSDIGAINCGGANTDCQAMIDEGTVVKLTAAPAATYTFAGWSGRGCIGADAINNVTVSADTTCIASFTK